MPANDPTRTHHVLFAAFANRFARAHRAQAGHGTATTVAETISLGRDAIVARAGAGALFAPTSGWDGQGPVSGGLLWIGDAGVDDEAKPVARLTDAEVRALDRRLRLSIEGGGEGELGLQWSELQQVPAAELDGLLQRIGVGDECEVCEISIALEGGDISFLFLVTPAGAAAAVSPGDGPPSAPGHLSHLLETRMPLTIRLGSTRMSLDDVLRLTRGSLVELDQREDEPLEVLAHGRVVARGEVVVVDERFGLRLTEVGSPQERARAVR